VLDADHGEFAKNLIKSGADAGAQLCTAESQGSVQQLSWECGMRKGDITSGLISSNTTQGLYSALSDAQFFIARGTCQPAS